MKKARRARSGATRAEYDLASMKDGVRGKYAKRIKGGTNLVLLESDVAAAFPNEKAVNQVLRAVIKAARLIPRRARRQADTLHPPRGRRTRGREKPRVARRG